LLIVDISFSVFLGLSTLILCKVISIFFSYQSFIQKLGYIIFARKKIEIKSAKKWIEKIGHL